MEPRLNTRRFALRAATAAAHEALEREMGAIGSRADYVRYLRATARFRGAIEPRLLAQAGFCPTAIEDCLRLDCADLGLGDLAPLSSSLDCAGAARLGVVYVLEGSAMGASLLIRSARDLGFDESFGARHLARQVERRSHFTTFVAHLESQPALDMETVAAAANATFALAAAAVGVAHAA